MNSRSNSVYGEATIIADVGSNDVLLGRGKHVLKNEGNKRFLALVADFKLKYIAATRHAEKNEIAKKIIATIKNDRKGLFLREVKQPPEHASTAARRWTSAEGDEILEKVKQALRDYGQKKCRRFNRKEAKYSIPNSEQPPTEHHEKKFRDLTPSDNTTCITARYVSSSFRERQLNEALLDETDRQQQAQRLRMALLHQEIQTMAALPPAPAAARFSNAPVNLKQCHRPLPTYLAQTSVCDLHQLDAHAFGRQHAGGSSAHEILEYSLLCQKHGIPSPHLMSSAGPHIENQPIGNHFQHRTVSSYSGHLSSTDSAATSRLHGWNSSFGRGREVSRRLQQNQLAKRIADTSSMSCFSPQNTSSSKHQEDNNI